MAKSKSSRSQYLIPFIVLGVFVLLISGCFYTSSTKVTGTEFNPKSWEIRRFSFHRDPFTNYQLSGITHSEYSGGIWIAGAGGLVGTPDPTVRKHLLPPSYPSDSRWDLVTLDGIGKEPGAASILVDVAMAMDADYQEIWTDWSTDHPKLAKILWPNAQLLALIDAYDGIPDLFQLASRKPDNTEFQDKADQLVRKFALDRCRELFEQGKESEAESVAKVVLASTDDSRLKEFISE